MKNAAKKYFEIGLSCLPCKQDKSPDCLGTWNKIFELSEFKNAKAIGIKCGKESNGLECIDLDSHDGNAKERLTSFIEQIKPLYEKYKFPIEQTQGGGYHFLYRCEKIEGNLKLAQQPKQNDKGKWIPDTIFETRGEGGYFVAYPSKGYKVVKNDIYKIPTITPEERDEIFEIARSFNTWTKPIVQNEYEKGEKPGDLYNNSTDGIANTENILEAHGWKKISKYNWARPGKTKGISATFGKVAENIFYCFSQNAYPFDANAGYTPFQVMALLEFNSDFKACAKHLAERLGLEKKQPETKQVKQEPKQPSIDEKIKLLRKSLINTDIEIEKPPTILYISDVSGTTSIMKRLMTLGNFSAIIGKAKSRKTFSMSMITAAMVKNGNIYNKFFGNLPDSKRSILYFDTEQGLYDSANVIKRVERLSKLKNDCFYGYNIREFTPLERCQIIEYALDITPGIGFVVIDGIADLAKAINDEEEATRVTGLLLRWTKQYDCHISTILHQNKNDNFATGHLGSSVMKKAEIVISVTKEKGSDKGSTVSCDFSRGVDFEDFSFFINEKGLPELDDIKYQNINETIYYD